MGKRKPTQASERLSGSWGKPRRTREADEATVSMTRVEDSLVFRDSRTRWNRRPANATVSTSTIRDPFSHNDVLIKMVRLDVRRPSPRLSLKRWRFYTG